MWKGLISKAEFNLARMVLNAPWEYDAPLQDFLDNLQTSIDRSSSCAFRPRHFWRPWHPNILTKEKVSQLL